MIIEEFADGEGEEEHGGCFCGGNPCDGRRAVSAELVCLVVVLEDADAGDPAEGAEEGEERTEDYEPGSVAAVWRLDGRIWDGLRGG